MALLLAIAALFLAWYALRRAKRVDVLEQKLRALETEVRLLRGREGVAGEAAGVEVEVAVEPVGVAPGAGVHIQSGDESPHSIADEAAHSIGGEAALSPPHAEPPAASSFAAQIDWESWLGVRGAAVLGGIVLALAGIFLFRYSIEHGLLPPWLRVIAGTIAGVACIVAAERYLRRAYAGTADAVEGAGIVILYASTWAARVLYDLIGTPTAFVSMIAITATCCVLSWRHSSLVIALLGLAGGFATPFLLASRADNPIGLFAYVLLLDLGLLHLARQRGWPLLALLSLVATATYQFAWIVWRMQPERVGLGLALLAIFAVVFAVAGRGEAKGEGREWLVTQIAGVLLPFAFVLYIAADTALSPRLLPLALLVLLLAAGACWLAAALRRAWLGLAAASASIAVVGAWASTHTLTSALAWEVAAVSVLLAAIFHLAVELAHRQAPSPRERGREREGAPAAEAALVAQGPAFWDSPAPAAILANLGFFWLAVILCDSLGEVGPWPWIAAWLVLAALLLRHAAFPSRAWLQMAAAVALAIGLSNAALLLEPRTYWALLLAVGVGLQVLAMRCRADLRRWADHAAAVFAAIALLGVSRGAATSADLAVPGVVSGLALSLMIALAGVRLRRGEWLLAAVLVGAFSQVDWFLRAGGPLERPALLLALELAGVAAHAVLPFALGTRFKRDLWAWPAAALAGPAWFLALHHLFTESFGSSAIGLLPVGLGAISVAQGWKARQLWATGDGSGDRNLVWFFAAAIGFVTLAIPLQLEKSWITIGWALEGLGVILLWRRFDVVWLKYFGVALLLSVTVRLIANPAVLGYYPRPTWRIVNWLLYTYLVPAAAMLASAQALRTLELSRARPWEAGWYARGRPLGAVVLGFAGMLAIFVWLNLAIADWFSAGPSLEVSLDRMPARDLAMSISWAIYGLLLLATGVRLRSVGVRWVSLGLMIITIAKVFLYDLGELTDLYRVASLLGLALSLIAVSLAYQRFVLRAVSEEP